MWYDPSDLANHWKQYNTGWAVTLNDLESIDHKMGFWLYVTDVRDGFLNVSGYACPSVSINLRAGWNMVGFPTTRTNITVADAFWGTSVNIVETFDSSVVYKTKVLGPASVMNASEGYWVHAVSDCVWTISNPDQPRMALTKSAPSSASAGSVITYALQYSNTGILPAYNVVITETYPSTVTYLNANPPPTAGNNVWVIPVVPAGTMGAVHVNVSIGGSPTQTLVNRVTLQYENVTGQQRPPVVATASTLVTGPILVLIQSAFPSAQTGQIITYNITLWNNGTDTAHDVTLTETYPAGVTFDSGNPPPDVGSNIWLYGDLPPGGPWMLSIGVRVTAFSGTLVNDIALTYESPPGVSQPAIHSTANTTVGGGPFISLIKSAPATACTGEYITYTISYANVGTETAYDVWVNESYPSGVTFVSAVPAPTAGGNAWAITSIAPGAFGTITVTVRVDATSGMLTNGASCFYANSLGWPWPTAWAIASTAISNPLMSLTKDGPSFADTGDIITYYLNYTNYGNGWGYNCAVTDIYPAGVTFISAIPMPTVIDNIWLLGNVAPGASGSIQITVHVDALSGMLVNSATLEYGNNAGVSLPPVVATSTALVNVPDTIAPAHSSETPPPGGSSSNATPVISVVVTDTHSGVNASTIQLYVMGYRVMVSVTAVPGGYRVSYWHEGGFASGTVVPCRIVAKDYAGNVLDYGWSFTVP